MPKQGRLTTAEAVADPHLSDAGLGGTQRGTELRRVAEHDIRAVTGSASSASKSTEYHGSSIGMVGVTVPSVT